MKKTILANSLILLGVACFLTVRGFGRAQQQVSLYEVPEELIHYSLLDRVSTMTYDEAHNNVWYSSPGDALSIIEQEYDYNTDQFEKDVRVVTASYKIIRARGRLGGEELYVAGIRILPTGGFEDVIERWTIPRATGQYEVKITQPPTPIGVPRGPLDWTVLPKGGVRIPPTDRNSGPLQQPKGIIRRELIYSGTEYGHFFAIEPDPEGRFLLALTYSTSEIVQFDLLSPPYTPAVIFSPATIPELAESEYLHGFTDANGRRVYLAGTMGEFEHYGVPYPVVVLGDPNNDGIFDDVSVIHTTAEELAELGPDRSWTGLDNFGWDFEDKWD